LRNNPHSRQCFVENDPLVGPFPHKMTPSFNFLALRPSALLRGNNPLGEGHFILGITNKEYGKTLDIKVSFWAKVAKIVKKV